MIKKELTQREVASMGGVARKKSLTAERRSEIASKAINARWEKERKRRRSKHAHAAFCIVSSCHKAFVCDCKTPAADHRCVSCGGAK